jgi:hypothetical protein
MRPTQVVGFAGLVGGGGSWQPLVPLMALNSPAAPRASSADVVAAELGGTITESRLAHDDACGPLLSANALFDVGRRPSCAHVASG